MSFAVATHLQWQRDGDHAQTQFFAEGMRCANCANAIRKRLSELTQGAKKVQANPYVRSIKKKNKSISKRKKKLDRIAKKIAAKAAPPKAPAAAPAAAPEGEKK